MLSKASKKNPILMEACCVLKNQVAKDVDGRFVADEDSPSQGFGPADGENKIRLFGLTRVYRIYTSDINHTKAVYQSIKVFSNIGRGVRFLSRENANGCLLKSYICYPVVLAFFENDDGELQLSAFSPRCFTSRLAIRMAVRKFEREFGDKLTYEKGRKPVKTPGGFSDEGVTENRKGLFHRKKGPEYEIDPNMVWNGQDWVPREEVKPDSEGSAENEKSEDVDTSEKD